MPAEPSRQAPESQPPSTIDHHGKSISDQETSEEDRQLVEILDAYLEAMRAGAAPSREDLIARYPHLAHQLEACLAGLEFIHRTETGEGPSPQHLGDFRLLREIGRGGMGVVYEAEQISLQRRVAVKVLRFGSISDPEAVDRFQREAETVARLHHTNIVPIFYVGREDGVNYYAMEFIDGQSLADVLAKSDGAIDPATVIDWGCQVAEALAHAHQRGVIHRDVKPSNLILDREGRLWLTDFGLAKRLDDVTLSLSGALLGTPRYMSPEQASAARNRLDHRTDLYSLGATLYELLTGQPVFSAESPHQVISQILNQEPTPPRLIRPSLSRDAETILLKCLAKEPQQRYASAQELASDLRALHEGRPIRARRASVTERAAKWARRHRHSLALSGGSFVAAAALLTIVLTTLLWYRHQQLVSVHLTTRQPPLAVELRDPSGNLLVSQTVPTQQPIQIPAQDYQLQVSGNGRLSETYEVNLTRGSDPTFDLDLDEALVNPPLKLERSYRVVAGNRGALAIQLNDQGLSCTEMQSSSLRWIISLQPDDQPLLRRHPGWIWPWHRLQRGAIHSGWGAFDLRPFVTSLEADLNEDGTRDFLVANRHQACLIAVSGKDGAILWVAARGQDLERPLEQTSLRMDQQGVISGVFAAPNLSTDVDGDGFVDLIALMLDRSDMLASSGMLDPSGEKQVDRWLECISSKTGQTLWRRDLDDRWFDANAGTHTPECFRWFVGSGAASSQIGGNPGADFAGIAKRTLSKLERVGYFHHAPSAPELQNWRSIPGAGIPGPGNHDGHRTTVTLLAGNHLLGFDAATGEPVGLPLDCGMTPGRPPVVADVDGDGVNEWVLIEQPAGTALGPSQKPTVRVGVFSFVEKQLLWTQEVQAMWPSAAWPVFPIDPPRWPQVADLDNDGRAELLVPNGTSRLVGRQDQAWGELQVLDAITGTQRWVRRLKTMDQQLDHFLIGPDLNADGFAEIFVSTLWSTDFDLYVDAISGRDGTSLWAVRQPLLKSNERVHYRLGQPLWWNGGSDGWPQLVIPISSEDAVTEPMVRIFSSGTGKLCYSGSNLLALSTQDADGDGIDDLFALEPSNSNALDFGGKLLCFRGRSLEPWNSIGLIWSATTDLDGDGLRDLIRVQDGMTIHAASSKNGRSIWTSKLPLRHSHPLNIVAAYPRPDGWIGPSGIVDQLLANLDSSRPQPPPDQDSHWRAGDLNGDGTSDLLVYTRGFATDQPYAPLLALSGKTGRILWQSEIQAKHVAGVMALDVRDLDNDGQPEVVWVGTSDWQFPESLSLSIHRKQLQLAVLSGTDGRLRWHQPLSVPYGLTPQTNTAPFELDSGNLAISYGDLNDDGIQELIVPANHDAQADPSSVAIRAFDGATGASVWSFPLPAARDSNQALSETPPSLVADLDRDGTNEVIVLTFETGPDPGQATAILQALEGADGRPRWQCKYSVPEDCGKLSSHGRSAWLRPRPILLQGDQNQPLLCLNLWDNPERIVVVDRFGKSVADFRLETERGYHRRQFRVWPCDTNGDGIDELVLTHRDRIMAIRPLEPERNLWQREISHLWTDEIEGILPASSRHAPVIVMRRVDPPASVYGVDAKTGQTLWTAPAPSARRVGNAILVEAEEQSLLNRPLDRDPAWLFYQHHQVSRVRLAAPRDADGTQRMVDGAPTPALAAMEAVRPSARRTSSEADPRLQRRLPWMPPELQPSTLVTVWFHALFYSLVLLYLPAVFIKQSWLRRRWSLKWLGLLPVIAACWLLAFLMQDESLPARGVSFKFILATLALPVIVWVARLLSLCREGRWRSVLACLAFICLLGLILGIVAIAVAQSNEQTALRDEEYLVWTGWWLMGVHAAYLTACVWLAARIVWFTLNWIRDLLQKTRTFRGSAEIT